jgi:hypothetical protein
MLELEFGKKVEVQDLHNLRNKMRIEKKGGQSEGELLQKWATEFAKTTGNVVEKLIDDDGVLQCIFLQSADMRNAFESYPELQY